MKDIRIGNDIKVKWSLYADEDPFNLKRHNVRLFLKAVYGKRELKDFTISGNTITWIFFGKDQKSTGRYSLELVLNDGVEGMITTDACDFVELVSCSLQASGFDAPGVQTESIDLVSNVEIGGVPITPDWNASEGEEGFIKNRTHYLDCDSYTPIDVESGDDDTGYMRHTYRFVASPWSDETKVAVKVEIYNPTYEADDYIKYVILNTDDYISGEGEDIISFKVGFTEFYGTQDGNEITLWTLTGNTDEIPNLSFAYIYDRQYKQLDEVFIPSNIARKSDVKKVAFNLGEVGSQAAFARENVLKHDEQITELSQEVEHQGIFIEDLQNTKIDKEADDYYPQLSVGTADNLSGVDDVARDFVYSRSGGGVISDGVARVQSIKGNSVVWNNLVDTRDKVGDSGWIYRNNDLHLTQGHKYALIRSKAIGGLYCIPVINGQEIYDYSLRDNIYAKIFTSAYTTTPSITHLFCEQNVGAVALIDLTKMVGCGYEPTTIEEFNARIPMGIDLYSFNGGEVIDMNVQGIKSVGRNLFNEEWELGGLNNNGQAANEADNVRSSFIRLIGGMTYYFNLTDNNSYLKAFAYDENNNFVGVVADMAAITPTKHFAFPSNATYIRFRVYKTDGITIASAPKIMLGIYDGEYCDYEPYMEASEDLSIVAKYFPNGMRSAGSANDEIRYNKATNRWEKVVRIGEVYLGSLVYGKSGIGDNAFYTTSLQNIIKSEGGMMSAIFDLVDGISDTSKCQMSVDSNGTLYFNYPPITDAASFKAAMQGVILYYELAEPIVTEIEEKDFNLDYSVWNCGTEQMVASKPSSALSADITYGFNAVGLIKQLRSMIEALSAKVANL